MQSSCQTCDCSKADLADENPHDTRSKAGVARQVNNACFAGIFPGWQSEQDVPRPIFTMVYPPRDHHRPPKVHWSIERLKLAERRLGVKLSSNSTWLFPHFDCYIQVYLDCFVFDLLNLD